jgi:hypothetical protein
VVSTASLFGQNSTLSFPFDNGATQIANTDISGTKAGGVSSISDRFGNSNSAFLFNGTTSYIDYGNNAIFNLRDGMSFSVWVNIAEKKSQSILSRGYAGVGDYSLDIEVASGQAKLSLYLEGANYFNSLTNVLPDGWNHIAVTCKTGTNNVKLYINGVLNDQATAATSLTGESTVPFVVGTEIASGYFFNGVIDDLFLFAKVINADEVQTLSNTIEVPDAIGNGFGNALNFDDLDYVTLSPDLYKYLDDFTFETWVNWSSGGSVNERIIEFGYGNNEYVFLTPNRFGIFRSSGGMEELCFSNDCLTTLIPNEWHHIAVSYKNDLNTVIIYLDGEEINRATDFQNNAVGLYNQFLPFFRIGSGAFTTNTFSGSLDETRLWSTAKTANQIKQNRNLPLAGNEAQLRCYFSYDAGIANGDNTNLGFKLQGRPAGVSGDLTGFVLNGGQSNFIRSLVNIGNIKITDIQPSHGIPGSIVKLTGRGFAPSPAYNKVFIRGKEAKIISASLNQLEIEIPDFDIDETGTQDLIVLNFKGLSFPSKIDILFEGEGYNYTFEEEVIVDFLRLSSTVEMADLNGNGYKDIVTAGLEASDKLLLIISDGKGGFNAPIQLSTSGAKNITLGDINGDGYLDILAGQSNSQIRIYLNSGNGNFNTSTTIKTGNINFFAGVAKLADIDQDGDLDIIYSFENSFTINYLANNGFGIFTDIPTALISDAPATIKNIELADLDNDGDLDAITTSYNEFTHTYTQEDPLMFSTAKLLAATNLFVISIEVAYLNDDDLLDIMVGNGFGAGTWYINEGGNNFSENFIFDATSPSSIKAADMDGNGTADLVISNYYGDTNGGISIHYNNGAASFTRNTIAEARFLDPRDVALSDYDSDGDLDIMATWHADNKIVLYKHVFSDKELLAVEVPNQFSEATISATSRTAKITVPADFRLDRAVPVFSSSRGSFVKIGKDSIVSGSSTIDFEQPVIFAIQAENGTVKNWTVSLNPLPVIPVLTEVDDISQTSAEVEWAASTYATSYVVQISDNDFNTYEEIETTELILQLDLLAGTNYEVRIGAKNAFGNSQGFSEIEEFTTVPSNPALPVIAEILTAAAVVSWEENAGTEQYLLDVSKDSTFNEFVGGYNNRGVASLAESIIGLQAGKRYWARIRASNETGTSGNSDTVTFITIPAKPLLSIVDEMQTSIELSWAPLAGADGYLLETYSPTDTLTQEFNDGQISTIFSSLVPATSYGYRLSGSNESGSSEDSDVVTALTVPATPEGLMVEDIRNTSGRLRWENVNRTNGYLLEVSIDDFSTKLSDYNPKQVNGAFDNLNDLAGGVTYKYRVKSVNESGESPYSSKFTFSTIPNSPVARSASSVTTTSFIANWDVVSGNAIEYLIELAQDEDFTIVTHQESIVGSLSKEFTTLDNGVSYWYRLTAKNGSGSSPRSNSILVEQPLVVLDFQFNDEKSRVEAIVSQISFSVKGGKNLHTVSVRYKGILVNDWSDWKNMTSTDGIYKYQFNSSTFDDIGLQFEVDVFDGVTTINKLDNYIYWTDTEEEILSLSLINNWQLFSIPYIFDDNLIETLFDEMGPFEYKSEWRLMQYDGEKYVDAGGGINRIELGQSYWFYTTRDVSINIEGGSVNTVTPFNMLLEEGWNQIGNPYNIPISWNSIILSNNESGNVEPIYVFNTQTQAFERGDKVDAFSGGFVWVNSPTEVLISLIENSERKRITDPYEIASHNIDETKWLVNIILQQGNKVTTIAAIGMADEASHSKDVYDEFVLPRFVKYTEMFTTHDDYFYPYFRKDIRAANDRESWLYTFESNEVAGLLTLRWENDDFKYASKHLWLINESNGDVIQMNSINEYSFSPQSGQQFSVHLTTGINDLPAPFKVLVSKPFPNPASSRVNVQLGLPQALNTYEATLSVYGPKGELIKTLNYKEIQSGMHKLSVDLNLSSLTSGLYYIKIDIEGDTPFTRIDKIVLK